MNVIANVSTGSVQTSRDLTHSITHSMFVQACVRVRILGHAPFRIALGFILNRKRKPYIQRRVSALAVQIC